MKYDVKMEYEALNERRKDNKCTINKNLFFKATKNRQNEFTILSKYRIIRLLKMLSSWGGKSKKESEQMIGKNDVTENDKLRKILQTKSKEELKTFICFLKEAEMPLSFQDLPLKEAQ